MQRFIVALVLSVLNQSPEAPPAEPRRMPAVPPVRQAEAAPGRLLPTPLPELEAVRAARSEIRHEHEGDGYRFVFPGGSVVEFSDRPIRDRDQAKRERVVQYFGTERASDEPDSTFEAAGKAAGISREAVTALRFISRHEGGFDAINTWDRARFSWGFIQFAGGYGFPPALAHFKTASPELFRKLLGQYGVDVQPGADGRPEPVYVDPLNGDVRRGKDAEQAYGDDPLVIALFIRAGRVPEVKQRQVEAAIRNYVVPALNASHMNVRLADVLRSPKSLAMLIDRNVHEGNVRRLLGALEQARLVTNLAMPGDWPRLESQVLDLAVRDADARASVAELIRSAAADVDRAAEAARNGEAGWVPGGPTLAEARVTLSRAFDEIQSRMVPGDRRERLIQGLMAVATGTDPAQLRMLDDAGMADSLSGAAASLRELVSGFRWERNIHHRLRNIRTSALAGP